MKACLVSNIVALIMSLVLYVEITSGSHWSIETLSEPMPSDRLEHFKRMYQYTEIEQLIMMVIIAVLCIANALAYAYFICLDRKRLVYPLSKM